MKFKEEIVDLAKNIISESQVIQKIAKSTAEECMDKTMKDVCHSKVGNKIMHSMIITEYRLWKKQQLECRQFHTS